jgi:bacteriocin biosynthesis cyclodehydratase domain-containing protein
MTTDALVYAANPTITILPVSDDEVIVRGGPLDGYSLIIRDEQARGCTPVLMESLAGGTTASELSERLSCVALVDDAEAAKWLEELHAAGVAVRTGALRSELADWIAYARFGYLGDASSARSVVIVGGSLAEALARRLQELGLDVSVSPDDAAVDWAQFGEPDLDLVDGLAARAAMPGGDEPDHVDEMPPRTDRPLVVAVWDEADMAGPLAFNDRALTARVPVLHLQAGGVEYAVGPYVVPGATACFWEYERLHARAGKTYAEYAATQAARPDGATLPDVTIHAFLATVTPFVVELALVGQSELAGQVLRGRSTTGETARSAIVRLPRCPSCMPLRPMLRNPLW